MQHLWKAGWRVLAVGSFALLVLLAGLAARTPGVGRAVATTHPQPQGAIHLKALPLPAVSAALDQPNPAPGYATALWSAGAENETVLAYSRINVVAVPIAYHVQTVIDPSLGLGQNTIAHRGTKGQAIETVRRIYENSQLVSVNVVGERVVQPPQNEIVNIGAKLPEVSRGELLGRVTKTLSVVATAYWADPSWSNGRTATGVPARYGVVAVDPSVIPLGTRLYIPGYGYAVAADTGSAIVGDRIDLCFNTGQQAIDYGRQPVTVYVLSSS
ncbi:MAG: 3D domain-containing protein [Thermaerobacter sp.]|nr:3D domain-containing protein [Thermaerobacter sp.]